MKFSTSSNGWSKLSRAYSSFLSWKVFDILLQGKTAKENVNLSVESGKADRAMMKAYTEIKVQTDLDIRFNLLVTGEGVRAQCLEISREDQLMRRSLDLNPFN